MNYALEIPSMLVTEMDITLKLLDLRLMGFLKLSILPINL